MNYDDGVHHCAVVFYRGGSQDWVENLLGLVIFLGAKSLGISLWATHVGLLMPDGRAYSLSTKGVCIEEDLEQSPVTYFEFAVNPTKLAGMYSRIHQCVEKAIKINLCDFVRLFFGLHISGPLCTNFVEYIVMTYPSMAVVTPDDLWNLLEQQYDVQANQT